MFFRRTATGMRHSLYSSRLVLLTRPIPTLRPLAQHVSYRPYFPEQDEQFGPSRRTRFFRSLRWAVLFGAAGVGAAFYYNDLLYEKMGLVKPDSQIDNMMAMDYMDLIDRCPAVTALKTDTSFSEVFPLAMSEAAAEEFNKPGNRDARRHLIYYALRGSRGVFPRAFYCESKAVLCLVVGIGHGLERHPDVPHGGIISTMFHEAMRVLAQAWFPDETTWHLADLNVTFTETFRSQAVYCITIMPASTVENLSMLKSDPESYGHWPEWLNTTDFAERVNTFVAYVGQCAGHPLHDPVLNYGHACAKFEVEGPGWPPEPIRQPLQLHMDGKIT